MSEDLSRLLSPPICHATTCHARIRAPFFANANMRTALETCHANAYTHGERVRTSLSNSVWDISVSEASTQAHFPPRRYYLSRRLRLMTTSKFEMMMLALYICMYIQHAGSSSSSPAALKVRA